ncbi:MAG: cupin domain-containing protein [Beijerinckiaceae bacterium]|jgi:quercetin dioxygenase-like cupin family protein|nr:cupin domain-containing protein [Beijerinckiaceae bacterium]MDO9441597.1 cupin domain-containing protein [Beijerinckiaceae bacterium]
MRALPALFATLTVFTSSLAAAHEPGFAKPEPVLKQIAAGMPTGPQQEIRVMTARFQPGDRTVTHTHRHPVTVYILEGAFTLQLDGREPVTIKAGEAMVEPPLTRMTGFNPSSVEQTRLVIFYVSTPDTPFLDMTQ